MASNIAGVFLFHKWQPSWALMPGGGGEQNAPGSSLRFQGLLPYVGAIIFVF